MSEEYLMTGSFGLDVDAWQGSFYDDDLPTDWRAAFYSTLLRSVILPSSEWHQALNQDWIDEVDETFRFVLYCEAHADADLSRLISELSELPTAFAAQVAGVVLHCASVSVASDNESFIKELQQLFPLCLDAGAAGYADSGMDVLCDRLGVSCVWYPDAQDKPLPSGDFLVTLISQQSLPEQREIVAEVEKWMSGQRRAGLYNNSAEDAPKRAQETRIMTELMGV